MDPDLNTPTTIAFGRFQLVPHRRELLADGQPVQIGGRAFDLLMVLLEAHGSVVSKDTLIGRVWPARVVEETNLQIQVSALRAALGADRELIRTIPGRGYQFTGETHVEPTISDTPRERNNPTRETSKHPTNIPESVSELVGRHDELIDILHLISSHRLVTLSGPGGIGKTRLALAAARKLLPDFVDGAWVTELAPLADPKLVPAAVAAVFELKLAAGEASADHVARALGRKELLLLIDNCEHVVEGAAEMVEALLRADPSIRILTTSREPLKAEGEWIYRVPPLAVPPADVEHEDELLRHGSVRLFIERAQAADYKIGRDPRLAASIATICRQLDGIPLAIELAAARTATLDIEHIAAHLDDRLRLLAGGRRTALPRQQTMRATLEWSHELLTAPERIVLRRLTVFAGTFDIEAAAAVVASPDMPQSAVIDQISHLVSKSLVDRNSAGYRLLETTRAFALEKLFESGEREAVWLRHAQHYVSLFERAEIEWRTRPAVEWLADYGPMIDNVRAALDWAFSPGGVSSVGVALTAAAVPLWLQLSLLQECRGRVERALSFLKADSGDDPAREMKLQVALAASTLYSQGRARELGAACTKALEIAESLGDSDYQLRSLRGLFTFNASHDFGAALEIAQRFRTVAQRRSDRNDQFIGDGLLALAQLYLGDQAAARTHIERMLTGFSPADRSHYYAIRFQFDQGVTGRMTLARILWQQGYPDDAMRMAESAVDEALQTNHAISTCNALTRAACPIALWTGDLAAAERHVRILLELATRYTLPLWCELGRMCEGVVAINQGDIARGISLLRTGFDELGEAVSAFDNVKFQTDLAEGLLRAGQISEGMTAVERAIRRCERTSERWLLPELVRIKGELALRDAIPDTAGAEARFREALNWARRQGALSWELRAATSLARLMRDQRRDDEAIAVLQPVYHRFTEGFGTADLKTAKQLINSLQ